MPKPSYKIIDTANPPKDWGIAYGCSKGDDGVLVVDTQPLTVKPGQWPSVPPGWHFLCVHTSFSQTAKK